MKIFIVKGMDKLNYSWYIKAFKDPKEAIEFRGKLKEEYGIYLDSIKNDFTDPMLRVVLRRTVVEYVIEQCEIED